MESRQLTRFNSTSVSDVNVNDNNNNDVKSNVK